MQTDHRLEVAFSMSLISASIRIDHLPAGTSRRSLMRQVPGPVASAVRLIGLTPADGLAHERDFIGLGCSGASR
jgi:hypothetical protein